MGGLGSGRYDYATTPTVEECLHLDVNQFTDFLDEERDGDRAGRCSWSNGDSEIRFQVRSPGDSDAIELRLCYAVSGRGETDVPVEEIVPLTFTECNFGGRRPWFQCPHCTERVGKLYKPPVESRFQCRACYDLAYQSSRVSGDETETAVLRYKRIHEQIDGRRPHPENPVAAPVRPVGMHETTYENLREDLREARYEYDEARRRSFAALYESVVGEEVSRVPDGERVADSTAPYSSNRV